MRTSPPLAHQSLEEILTQRLSERIRWRGDLPLDQPTDHMPGTQEKIEVLAYRKDQKLNLWHPYDAGEELWIEERARMGVRLDNGSDTNDNQIVFHERRAVECECEGD